MKRVFIIYGICVKEYNIWDPLAIKVLYRRNVVFKEVDPSPIVVQPKEDEKKSVVQLPINTDKDGLENEQEVHVGHNEDESSKSSKEEEKT